MDREREYLAIAIAPPDGVPAAEVRRAVSGVAGPHARVVAHGGAIVVVHPVERGADRAAAAEAFRARVAEALASPSVTAGAAGPHRGVSGAHRAALEAQQALLVGRALLGEGRAITLADLGPYGFVLGQPECDLRAFCERILGPLAAGKGWHEDLARTLEAYLTSHGSTNEVARKLFLHRNTVRQRLRRIAELTGADLDDADARLALRLALLGRRALATLEARAS